MTVRWAPERQRHDGQPGAGMRVAVAGASHWHLPRHATNLKAAGATFVAVSDADKKVAERWASELGATAVGSTEDVIRAKPDVVLALGRVADMAAQAAQLIDAALPVLAEKPLGLNPGEIAPLVELAERKNAWCSVALVRRYDPLWSLLDRLRDEGTLGTISHAHLRIVNGPPQRYAAWGSGWMLDPATAGGGALLNLGIHGLDFIRHLASEPVWAAGATVSRRAHKQKIEAFGCAVLRSESGIVGTVEAGYTYPDAAAGMTRSGDNETLVAATGAYITARENDVTLVTVEGEQSLPDLQAGDRYAEWMVDSLVRLRAGQPPAAGITDCLEAVRLVFDAYSKAGE